ncbi:bifunctional UDP-N-acetylglucosamine diphosphorylase/glucosamine-1-phosphate N-acetyltransferase GlmU [Thermovibrio sp.]
MGFKAVILAAGKGTRFKSELPKVLHKVLGKPMLWYVIKAAKEAGAEDVIVVVGHKKELVEEFLKGEYPDVKTVYQEEQLGTGHAVMCGAELLKGYGGKVVVLNGDAPLIRAEDIRAIAQTPGDMVVLTAETDEPTGYGRVVRDGDEVLYIVEEKDATEEEKRIKEVNSGVYAFDCEKLLSTLSLLSNDNAQGEYYLPDLLKIFKEKGYKVVAVKSRDFDSLRGVNNRCELSVVEGILRDRIVRELQLSGVTVHQPQTVYIEPEVKVGRDTEIFGPVYLRGKTEIGEGCYVGPYCDIGDSKIGEGVKVESHCWLRGALLEDGSSVGPFAKLRPGTVLKRGARVGTFVETKNALLEEGAKANHLTYLGDCRVGRETNIGAGTITCNYDGFNKWFTDIGERVFVGSNTLFIAPVKVGDGAITAAGSVITSDVPENALAVARSKQVNYPGKAEVIREKARKKKEGRS